MSVAPMADVTDSVFRKLISKYSRMQSGGGPDIMWNEFVSADGLVHELGREHLISDLKYSESERPILAQLFGSNSANIQKSAELCASLGYDGIDLNMGCPDRTIMEQGAGSALINTPNVAKEIIRNAKLGAPSLPITVKTRIGYNTISWQEWLPNILDEGVNAITIHLRTRKELSLVDAHYELATEIVKWIRDTYGYPSDGGPFVFLNGDVKSLEMAHRIFNAHKPDGVMVGRGVFGKPWFFDLNGELKPKNLQELFDIVKEHTRMYEVKLSHKSFAIMKKHFKAYINNFDNAKDLRIELMNAKNSKEISNILDRFLTESGDTTKGSIVIE